MKKTLIVLMILITCGRARAESNAVVSTVLSNTDSYLVVDLVNRKPYQQSNDIWQRFPIVIPHEIPAGYLAAGPYLFEKDRVAKGQNSLPITDIMALVDSHDQTVVWPICRCITKYVMAAILLNAKGNVEAVMMFDVHHDSFTVEDVKGNSYRFRFGYGDGHTGKLITTIDPGLEWK